MPADGRRRIHTHPSQLPQPDAISRRPTIMVRAPREIIDGIDRIAKKRGISRNTFVVELIEKATSRRRRE